MAAVSASSRRTSNAPGSSTAARSPGMLRTSCCRGLKFRTGKGPKPSADAGDGCRQATPMRPATSARHVEPTRRSSEQSMSVWKIQAGEDGASLFAISIVDSTDHIGSDDSPEPDTRRHAVVLKTHVLKIVKHLSCVQEGGHFKIRCHAGDLCSDEMYTFFHAGRDQMLI